MPGHYPFLLLIQIFAVASTAIAYSALTSFDWLLWVYIFGFSHYFMAAYYSYHKFIAVLSSPKHYLALGIVSVLGYASYTYSVSFILLYFGLHHALSEAYLHYKYIDLKLTRQRISFIQAASFFTHLGGFILLVRHDAFFVYEILIWPALIMLVIALWFLLALVWRSRQLLSALQISRLFGSEALLLGALVISIFHPFTFIQVVFYHFALWALLPFIKLTSRVQNHIKPISVYIALTLVSLFIVVKISPLSHSTSSRFFLFQEWFYILSYTHITLSYVISNANPQWINNLFNTRPIKAPST